MHWILTQTLPKTCRLFIATTQFAEYFIQQQLGLGFTQEWPKFGAICQETLQIDDDDLVFLYADAKPIVASND